MRLVTLPVGSLCVDTLSAVSPAQAVALRRRGIAAILLYLEHTTRTEVEHCHAAGLVCGFISEAPLPGWMPSAGLGIRMGSAATRLATALGLPRGTLLWADYEAPGGNADDSAVWSEKRTSVVRADGFDDGLYVGDGSTLDGKALFHRLPTEHYWRSGSDVPNVAVRGYEMLQLIPLDTVEPESGLEVDYDVVQVDRLGSTPSWVAA